MNAHLMQASAYQEEEAIEEKRRATAPRTVPADDGESVAERTGARRVERV
jgi:hypothetical protein